MSTASKTTGLKVVATTSNSPTNGEELKPLEDRIFRINQLNEMLAKHERLLESQKRLKNFLSGVEKDNLQISIKNTDYSSREEFTTKNIVVIEEVLECLIKTTDKKVKEIEPLLVW